MATATPERSLRRLYLIRATIAIGWAILLATLGTSSPVAAVLLVFYPLLDVVASLVDAMINKNTSAATTQYLNAMISAVTAAAIGYSLTRGIATSVAVFGAWAIVSGLIQLGLAIRRRRTLGGQWVMILSGALSAVAGANFALAASPEFKLSRLSGYALLGAIFFVITALRLPKATQARPAGVADRITDLRA